MPWKIVAGGKGCPFEVVRTVTGSGRSRDPRF
jgi:hypothetical protein